MAQTKYYRSIKKRIESDIAVQENIVVKTIKSPKVQRIDLSDIYIPRFPSRLKKGIFRGLDKRYYLILIGSIVFHVLMLIILYNNTSFDMSEEKISRLQSRYVNLILEKAELPSREELEEEYRQFSRLIPEPEDLVEETPSDLTGEARARRQYRRERAGSRETKVPDAEFLSEERQLAQEAREGQRSALSAQVGSMGILEYMKSRIITSKVDEDFLNYTDRTTQNFIRMMDGMDPEDLALFKLNRAGADGFGFGFGVDSVHYQLKTRRSRPRIKAVDLFGRENAMVEFEEAPVDKNENFEKSKTRLDALAKFRNRIVQRTASELSKTIRSHNRAIQDCYKTVLRREVNLRGKVEVRIGINSQGRVVRAEIVSSTLNNEQVEQCILTRIRRWKDFGICPSQKGIFSFSQSYSFGE